MKRITVEEVRAAVEKTGIRLVRLQFGRDAVGDKPCIGCALTALWLNAGNNPKFISSSIPSINQWAHDIYGESYIDGFLAGFDDGYSDTETSRYTAGYRDGCAVRESLLETADA